ncbi:MAG: hypothetical protein ACLSIF_11610 [Faecalimonas umbilicata]
MAGYICSYIIALIAVVAGVFFMIYPFYHKIVCKMPTTATVIIFRKDGAMTMTTAADISYIIRYFNIGQMER